MSSLPSAEIFSDGLGNIDFFWFFAASLVGNCMGQGFAIILPSGDSFRKVVTAMETLSTLVGRIVEKFYDEYYGYAIIVFILLQN